MRTIKILTIALVAGYIFAGCLSFALAGDEKRPAPKKYARRGEGVLVSQERKPVKSREELVDKMIKSQDPVPAKKKGG